MNSADYHLNGYAIGAFADNAERTKLLSIIRDIHAGTVRPGFEMQQKYKMSSDLKPNVYQYDPVFVDILFSNNIPEVLKSVTGKDLVLAHVQLRISFPEGGSYMSWHRDTHVYGGQIVGNIPPVHKIIFYPTVDGVTDARLKVVPGSHRFVFGNKYIDFISALLGKKKTISASDSEYLLFNTELFHHVVPEHNQKGSFRLIYSFCEKEQLKNYEGQEELFEMYQKRMI
ncbi:MAG TPA: hypothetical protein PK950_03050 [Candidatus Paceibacterota bacterium]|nr:hypothetical protein [Candidatus Paceibacterota bacterium]